MSEFKTVDPIKMIEFRMEQMNWSPAELARKTGFTRTRISEYLHYKRKLPIGFIRAYHAIAPATPLELLIQDYDLPNKPINKEEVSND